MRIKFNVLMIVIFMLSGCEHNKSNILDKKDGYDCVVRVELVWKDNISRYERDNLMRQFGDNALFKSNGKDLIAISLNNNDELIHVDYTNDIKCIHKYKETQRIFDTYLKPLSSSPTYKVIKKDLKESEFDNLEVKLSYTN